MQPRPELARAVVAIFVASPDAVPTSDPHPTASVNLIASVASPTLSANSLPVSDWRLVVSAVWEELLGLFGVFVAVVEWRALVAAVLWRALAL